MSDNICEYADCQISSTGMASFKVSDGHILVINTDMLKKLLSISESNMENRVVVFLKTQEKQ